MKTKLIIPFIIIFSCILYINIYAADTIKIKSAVIDNSCVIVEGNLSSGEGYLTLRVTALNLDDISYYIDQLEPKYNNGDFTVKLNMNDFVYDNSNVYIVRLGSENTDKAAQMILINNNDETKVLLGDVNCDGYITAADAALTLQYVLESDNFSNYQINAMRVNKGDITADNAAQILYKTINDMYIFPVEY